MAPPTPTLRRRLLRLLLLIALFCYLIRRHWKALLRPRLLQLLDAHSNLPSPLDPVRPPPTEQRRAPQVAHKEQRSTVARPSPLSQTQAASQPPSQLAHAHQCRRTEPTTSYAQPQQVRLQVSITRLKLRNMAPRQDKSLASLRKLLWRSSPPPALAIALKWGRRHLMHTGALQYPQPGETPLWSDRFTFEHVTEREAIRNEELELELVGVDEHQSQLAATATNATRGSALGRVSIPIEALACGPTRNDHPLREPRERDARAPRRSAAGEAAQGTANAAEKDDEPDDAPPTGARLAFRSGPSPRDHHLHLHPPPRRLVPLSCPLRHARHLAGRRCRVSELREWRLQLDNVRLKIKADALEPTAAEGPTQASICLTLRNRHSPAHQRRTALSAHSRHRAGAPLLSLVHLHVWLDRAVEPRTRVACAHEPA